MMGGGGGGQGDPLDPGTYTLTLTIGERSFTQELTIERIGDYQGPSSPF